MPTSKPPGAARTASDLFRRRLAPVTDADLERYARAAARLIRAARLNQYFPDPAGVAERLSLLAPAATHGVYTKILIDSRIGMPSLKDVQRIDIDRDLARGFLEAQEARLTGGRTPTARGESKMAYYRRLLETILPPLKRLSVTLRRVEREKRSASFEVILDRFDPAEILFVRYTIFLRQEDRAWGRELVERNGDYGSATGAFRRLMETCAQDDSEILFLLMGKRAGIQIEEVVRGRIGPLWSPWSPAPAGWIPEPARPEAFVLHCPLDRASIHLRQDRDDDPLDNIYRNFLSSNSRTIIEECAQALGYHTHKDRKFVCTSNAADSIRRKLADAGTRNVVYAVEN